MNRKMRFTSLIMLSLAFSTVDAKVRCSDFSTQSEAQRYMRVHGTYYLDRDKDGEACECLPGGSAYGSSVCR